MYVVPQEHITGLIMPTICYNLWFLEDAVTQEQRLLVMCTVCDHCVCEIGHFVRLIVGYIQYLDC
jgi:hypothetical protein